MASAGAGNNLFVNMLDKDSYLMQRIRTLPPKLQETFLRELEQLYLDDMDDMLDFLEESRNEEMLQKRNMSEVPGKASYVEPPDAGDGQEIRQYVKDNKKKHSQRGDVTEGLISQLSEREKSASNERKKSKEKLGKNKEERKKKKEKRLTQVSENIEDMIDEQWRAECAKKHKKEKKSKKHHKKKKDKGKVEPEPEMTIQDFEDV